MMRVLGIGGEPCTGKSTLMQAFLGALFADGAPRLEIRYRTVRAVYHRPGRVVVLGVYTPGHKFPGTDRLSMGVQPDALAFVRRLQARPETDGGALLFEGDRLFNGKFIRDLSAAGIDLRLWRLVATPEELERRHRERADSQPERFLRSRKTKLDNLMAGPPPLEVAVNDGGASREGLLHRLLGFAGIKRRRAAALPQPPLVIADD